MRHRASERGAVALLTTIIVGILLAIVATGLIALMVSELSQSNDSEQSIRAYYAAQSGVEDGITKVVAALGTTGVDQLCGTPASQNTNLDPANPGLVGWTCQQITYSGSPQGSLPTADKAVQIDVGPVSFRSMILEWDITPPPVGGYPPNFFNAPLVNFPSQATGWPYAAPIEVNIVEYPIGSFSASTPGAINLYTGLVVPRTAAVAPVYDYTTLSGANPLASACNPAAASYHCKVVIDRFNNGATSYLMRLRSRYVGSDYKLTFTTGNGGNGAVVPVPDGTATIDITAKAGDAFRRVIYKVPIRNGAAGGLDYVIYADNDVCKGFTVINGAAQAGSGCPY
ncbi:MAG TPA: hypothetical protein VLF67_05525 [Candidatus Saccharimonas sp.]|nr:hypothetical protein [Candidatus Saccharimonas sp.]